MGEAHGGRNESGDFGIELFKPDRACGMHVWKKYSARADDGRPERMDDRRLHGSAGDCGWSTGVKGAIGGRRACSLRLRRSSTGSSGPAVAARAAADTHTEAELALATAAAHETATVDSGHAVRWLTSVVETAKTVAVARAEEYEAWRTALEAKEAAHCAAARREGASDQRQVAAREKLERRAATREELDRLKEAREELERLTAARREFELAAEAVAMHARALAEKLEQS